MVITAKDLRTSASRIISLVDGGKELTLTFRGKAVAKIVPIRQRFNEQTTTAAMAAAADEAFGMWSDNSTTGNVPGYVRSLRESSRYDY